MVIQYGIILPFHNKREGITDVINAIHSNCYIENVIVLQKIILKGMGLIKINLIWICESMGIAKMK